MAKDIPESIYSQAKGVVAGYPGCFRLLEVSDLLENLSAFFVNPDHFWNENKEKFPVAIWEEARMIVQSYPDMDYLKKLDDFLMNLSSFFQTPEYWFMHEDHMDEIRSNEELRRGG